MPTETSQLVRLICLHLDGVVLALPVFSLHLQQQNKQLTKFFGGHQVTGGDDVHSKGTGLSTEVGDVTLELVPKFH
jgi:hypothetical protein